MELLVEFFRVLTATLSRHTVAAIKATASNSKTIRSAVISTGRLRHNIAVRIELRGGVWRLPFRRQMSDDSGSKVEVLIKPIEDTTALDLGAGLVGDCILLCIMLGTMTYSVKYRAKRFKQLQEENKIREEHILSRIQQIEMRLGIVNDASNKSQ